MITLVKPGDTLAAPTAQFAYINATFPGSPPQYDMITQSFGYDERSRQTSLSQTVAGTTLTMGMGYDSADRLTTQTYPGGEVVTTTYDAAGRALSLCPPTPATCYVANTGAGMYSALDQPQTRISRSGLLPISEDILHGLIETFCYAE